jgi:multiple sugar transport system ATP-binding protein
MAGVRFEHVNKTYSNNVTVIPDLNLDIRDKEFLVLVGPSGCGKSTALRMIAGLEDVSAGDLYIGERRVNDVAPKDRDIAMVFQSYALYPHMSVYDNMAFGLKLRKVPKPEIDKRVQEAGRILGIQQYLDRKPKALSGGQRQRVALGRAIVREPQVYLMDEPLSNLDAKLRVQTRSEISKLHQRVQTTTVYVTHDQTEAMTMGDRIAVMNQGVLQQFDTPEVLYTRPANQFVAGFIGSPAMNFFDVRVEGDGQNVYLQHDYFRIEVPGRMRNEVGGYAGREVVLGVRPEDIEIHPEPPADTAARITVDVVEPLGNEVVLYLLAGEQQFVARVSPECRVNPGQAVAVTFDLDKIHVFDKETEQSLFQG